jgi:hypothetical protein
MLSALNPQSRALRKVMKPFLNDSGSAKTSPSAWQQKGREGIESSSSSGARASVDDIGAWLRSLVGEEPVLVDPDVRPVLEVMAAGATPADVEAGIVAAMAAPRFRPRSWDQLVGWIRHATKDRLAVSPKAAVRGASTDTPSSNPNIELMREYHQQMMEERHGAERTDSSSPVIELFAAGRRNA